MQPIADTPWYRQFWPWFLIALPGAVVLASIATLVLAVRTHDPLVTDPADEPPASIRTAPAAQR